MDNTNITKENKENNQIKTTFKELSSVNVNNKIAISLYKKYNFKEIGLRKKYYHNIDDALIMTLYL